MFRHHVIISGTGRAGTTFLVQLCTELGLDTGFRDRTSGVFGNCNAGLEFDLRREDAPYIVKSPWICDYIETLLEGGEVVIDHAFIPVRDLFSAAESRRDVAKRTDPTLYGGGEIPGGLWLTDRAESQESILQNMLYKLIHALARFDIPATFLHFPRLTRDPKYLFGKLEPVLHGITYVRFLSAYRIACQPELVHEFLPSDASRAS